MLFGSCMAGGSDFKSNGLLLRLMGLMESMGTISTSSQGDQTLTGYLKDEDGNAIANATLTVQSDSSSALRASTTNTTTTDSEGKFSLTFKIGSYKVTVKSSAGSSLGIYSVSATSPNIQPTLTAQSGNLSLTINNFNNGAAPLSPSLLTFGSPNYTFTLGITIFPITPTVSGTLTSCSAKPSLPAGLFLSARCIISGTPTVLQSSISYSIRGRNSYGDTITKITITVNALPPSNLSYAGSPFTFTQGALISTITPSVSGTVTSCSISPNLTTDTGLVFNSTNCDISGTPTILKSATNYTITASNWNGSTNAVISIAVQLPNYIVSMPTGLLKTGQTTVYQTGDDGTYQKGVARIFTIGGSTGLLWQRCSAGQNDDATCSGSAQTYTWAQANSYCSSLNLVGRSWRLPTVNELANLIDYGKNSSPSIDSTAFPNTWRVNYWSSSTYAQDTTNAWYVDLNTGAVYYGNKTNSYYVRCVTGP